MLDLMTNSFAAPKVAASPIHIVFFAPSAVTYALPHLMKHLDLPTISPTNLQESPLEPASTKIPASIYAIGPTTRDFLQGDMGLQVIGTAVKPNPESLTAVMSASKDPQC